MKMKKRHVFKIYLVLLMLIMTACGGGKDAPVDAIQEYGSTVQSSAAGTEKPKDDVQKNPHEHDSEMSASQINDSGMNDSEANESVNDESDIDGSATNDLDINDWNVHDTETQEASNLPTYGEYYYDLKNVVLYLEVYDELPPNYITKREAQELGWEGGSVEKYQEGAAIGGDYFGNREGLLPKASGRSYTECDIDTNGYSSRGSRRLVFSNDGLYFYTADHYESFSEVTVTEDYEVIW